MAEIKSPEASAVAVADQFGRTAKRLARAFDDALAHQSVTTPRARALLEVAANGPLRLAAVAEAIGIAQGTASEMAEALVREGLLARREDPSDRRAVLLEATSSGLARAAQWRSAYEQAAADLFRPLSSVQHAELLKLLEILDP
jgi:DNA-binding MarR family transcriptional regulator